jgi:hypothetical protein
VPSAKPKKEQEILKKNTCRNSSFNDDEMEENLTGKKNDCSF